jgi:hypothetical protein
MNSQAVGLAERQFYLLDQVWRSQLKAAVTKMVQQCCSYVRQMPSNKLKLKLMDTFRTVWKGIFELA